MMPPANATRPPEPPEIRLKRLRHQSWRRGTREMDLILGRFADSGLAQLSGDELAAYEALLQENDWDLYYWVTGAREAPDEHAPLIESIARFHAMR